MTEYNANEGFRTYVDKYCDKHGTVPEIATSHFIVRDVEKEYRRRRLEYKIQ